MNRRSFLISTSATLTGAAILPQLRAAEIPFSGIGRA